MPRDVRDHHNRVVDQDADRKDEREQTDTVDRVAHHPRCKERQQDRHRNDDRYNARLPPSDRKAHEQHDGNGGKPEVIEEFIRLLVRGLPIVARDDHLDIAGDESAFELLKARLHLLGNDDCVRTRALCQRDSHRRHTCQHPIGALTEMPCPPLQRFGAHYDIRDIAHINRPPVARTHHQQTDVRHARQRLPRRHRYAAALVANVPGKKRAVRLLDLVDQLLQRHAVKRQLFRIGLHPDLIWPPPGNKTEPHIVDLGEFDLQVLRHMIERVVFDPRRRFRLRRQSQRQDRHVVDAAPDDQRLRDSDRNTIEIAPDLLMHADNGVVRRRADQKPRRHHRAVVRRIRIDVLDAVDRLDDRLQWLRHKPDCILCLQSVRPHYDVDHRHGNLRLLFARQRKQGQQTQRQRRQKKQRRQRGIDEGFGKAP